MGFITFLRSFDVFGAPVSLNYKGETTFKTFIGALFSIAIKIFLIIYASNQLLTLFSYGDPSIQIFTKYTHRPKSEEINLGRSFGDLCFALFDTKKRLPVKPDPSYLTFNIMIAESDNKFNFLP